MKTHNGSFDEHAVLHNLAHFLPAQNPLKDFVHHNTLHAFQHKNFHKALQEATTIFGYKTYLSLEDFRQRYANLEINESPIKAEELGKLVLRIFDNTISGKIINNNQRSELEKKLIFI